MKHTVRARRLLTGTEEVHFPVVEIEDGRIVAIASGEEIESGKTLTPAFFDVHVHGARSFDFMTAAVAEIGLVGRYFAGRGVGRYLATTVTGPLDATLRALDRLADAVGGGGETEGAAVPVGVHLEGPFVSCAKRGVHPVEHLRAPEVALFQRFWEAARGHIRLMTVAPELAGTAELIEYAVSLGVRVSLGHSDATEAEALAGIRAGAVSATHTFNAMRALGHREPGILGTVLDQQDLYAELICDGVHVAPPMVRLWLKAKGADRGILVTDGMAATGAGDGEYLLGDLPVEVRDGVCRLRGTKTLAGSVLTMDAAVANVREFTGCGLDVAVRLACSNPARMLGLEAEVKVGMPADFNLFAADGTLEATMLAGRTVGRIGW